MLELRDYQGGIYTGIMQSIHRYLLAVLPTGAGKTVVFSHLLHTHNGAACAIAHRQELVSQISLALARDGVVHRIIGPHSVVRLCVTLHMQELGRAFYNPNALVAVAGVDTLIRRRSALDQWLKTVTLWVIDEAHHLLKENKWGLAAAMFPNAKGVGFTATPVRTDGKGLGSWNDGVFEDMITGPSGRDLINQGYLTDYRIYAPPSDLDVSNVPISSATGDYSPVPLKAAVRRSHIVGDIVEHYLRVAPGKLGVTFVPDIETALDVAKQFNSRSVPAAVISSKTPDRERIETLKKFRAKKLLQLVNVDIFGEGFDLPAIEVVSLARPTQSYALLSQQFGRGLRVMVDGAVYKNWSKYTTAQRLAHIASSTKPHAIILDHAGNIMHHARTRGLPDAPQVWSLERREKRRSNAGSTLLLRTCIECTAVYDRILDACPLCGAVYMPTARSTPEQVDGNLLELTPEALAILRGAVDAIDKPADAYRAELVASHCPAIGVQAHVKRHLADQEAQAALRESIAYWAGAQRAQGRTDSESYRKFYLDFGIDVMSAKALHCADAALLTGKVQNAYSSNAR